MFWISIMKHLNIIVFSPKSLFLAEIYQLQLNGLLNEPRRTWVILPGKEGSVFSLVSNSIEKNGKTRNPWSDLRSEQIYLQSIENLKGEQS